MSDIKGTSKPVSIVATLVMLLITVASTSYAFATRSVLLRQDAIEIRVQKQEIEDGRTAEKVNSMKEQLDRIEGLLTRHVEGNK